MDIDGWIMWLPTKDWFWEPRNVQNVRSYGAELSAKAIFRTNHFHARLNINYNYSPSVNRERNFDEDDTYKKQLPYIPKHKANALLNIEYKNCFLTIKRTIQVFVTRWQTNPIKRMPTRYTILP